MGCPLDLLQDPGPCPTAAISAGDSSWVLPGQELLSAGGSCLAQAGPNDGSRWGCKGQPLPQWGTSQKGHLRPRASSQMAEASVVTALQSTPPQPRCPGSATLFCRGLPQRPPSQCPICDCDPLRSQGESVAGLELGFLTPPFQGFLPRVMPSCVSVPSPVHPFVHLFPSF